MLKTGQLKTSCYSGKCCGTCGRKLVHERTQCRAALSDKDVKLAELNQQLITANTQCLHATDEVPCYYNSADILVNSEVLSGACIGARPRLG